MAISDVDTREITTILREKGALNCCIGSLSKISEGEAIKKAQEFANQIKPIILPLRNQGFSYTEIANRLNVVGIGTPRGAKFRAAQVQKYATKYLEVS